MIFRKLSRGRFSPLAHQARRWWKANKKMGWQIPRQQFQGVAAALKSLPPIHYPDHCGAALCYGFGDDGKGRCDAILSGKRAWQYAQRRWGLKTWQCRYIDFDKADHVRLRPGAPARPKGFYFAAVRLPAQVQSLTVAQFLKRLPSDRTGLGPEGLQMLCITNRHLANQMHAGLLPFIALADYDVAPYGYNDFFDAMQMFCSNDTLGLGIGNVDRNYPLFGMADMAGDVEVMASAASPLSDRDGCMEYRPRAATVPSSGIGSI